MKIKLSGLCKRFQETLAVDHLDVEIEDGFLVCLLGPSGCGKSTTLSMIAGLEKPSEGTVYFDGKNVNDIEAEDRDIGMVFQDYALYPHMTAAENIAFPLKMKGVPKAVRAEKVSGIAKLMQIEDLLSRKPGKMSGGQQQRVAIARALVKEPKLLLLDEPLSNLDARLRIELRDEIRKLQKKLGLTTIFVTHDQEEAMSISDRILLLNQGKAVQYDMPKKLYMEPADAFAGRFLGNPPMNLIPGVFSDGMLRLPKAGAGLQTEGVKLHLAKQLPETSAEDGQEVLAGIRPEDLVLSAEGTLSGVVQSVQTLGKELYIRFLAGESSLVACTDWEQEICEGQSVSFLVKQIHLFAPEQALSGEAEE